MLDDPLITAVLNNVFVEPELGKPIRKTRSGKRIIFVYRIDVRPCCTVEAVVPVSNAGVLSGELQRLNCEQKPWMQSLVVAYVGSQACGKHATRHSN